MNTSQADEKYPQLKKYIDRWATKDFLAIFHKTFLYKAKSESRAKEQEELELIPKNEARPSHFFKLKVV